VKKAFVTALLVASLCATVGSGCIKYKGYRIPIAEQHLRVEPHSWWPRDNERKSPSTRIVPMNNRAVDSSDIASGR